MFGGIKEFIRVWTFYVDPLHWHYLEQARRSLVDSHQAPAAPAVSEFDDSSVENEAAQAPPLLDDDAVDEGRPTELTPRRPRWVPTIVPVTETGTPQLKVVSAWTTCKDLQHPESNEDAALWVPEIQRAAVFDGATESFAAKRWVAIIREAWKTASKPDLKHVQVAYDDEIGQMQLSWAQEQASERGSFTTIASIEPTQGGLAATCIGDSAILLIKDDRIIQAYPSPDPSHYSSVPDALGSSSTLLGYGEELLTLCTWTIPVTSGDVDQVILATDAVAVWLLTESTHREATPLQLLLGCSSDETWNAIVVSERHAGRMKTDDSTAVVLSLEIES